MDWLRENFKGVDPVGVVMLVAFAIVGIAFTVYFIFFRGGKDGFIDIAISDEVLATCSPVGSRIGPPNTSSYLGSAVVVMKDESILPEIEAYME